MDFVKMEHNDFMKCVWFASLIFCASLFVVFPSALKTRSVSQTNQTDSEEYTLFTDESLAEVLSKAQDAEDPSLQLLRQPQTRASVEWFYTQLANDRDVALAILEAAEEYDIPVSLAFSVAYAESTYVPTARHVNKNGSIDRGLFQLNDRAFPNLSESEFFNTKKSAHYGMSHLRFCLDTAGNEIAAIAMYNAGSNKVHDNRTPKTTLDYIAKVENYRARVERSFESEVLSFYKNNGAGLTLLDKEPAVLLAKK